MFFNASLSVDADELKSWRTELFGNDAVDRRALDEELPTMLHELEPIVHGVTGRELLVTTANPEWTAYFAGRFAGADQGVVGNLARLLKCRAVVASSILLAIDHSAGRVADRGLHLKLRRSRQQRSK